MHLEIKKENCLETFNLIDNNEEIISLEVLFEENNKEKASLWNLGFNELNENKYIKKGYASILIKKVIDLLKEKGINEITLSASSTKDTEQDKRLYQEELIKFYNKFGFNTTCVLSGSIERMKLFL